MFFSPDLLSKRDSGFGLLWLAATLGSKSTFKKLPRRSVLTADISQLCQLIAAPAEPLALRLSSNLLVGAARVYRVKQEIFMSDVTTCFNSLKRVEHEFRSLTSSECQLQMAQPSVKLSAVTLRADPRAAFSLEFDAMVTNWDEYLNPEGVDGVEDEAEDDYHPTAVKKGKARTSNSEVLRATACTLPESHDFLLASSFDASVGGNGMTVHSSSQVGGFAFDDTFDGLDIGEGVGDDLVRELGEGWGVNPIDENAVEYLRQPQEVLDMHFDTGELDDGVAGFDDPIQVAQSPHSHISTNLIQDMHAETVESQPSPSLAGTTMSANFQATVHGPRSPPGEHAVQDAYVDGLTRPEENRTTSRKNKRTRLVLDVRTELTDEELKATRMYYLDKQNIIRCELEIKRLEKGQSEQIRSLLWDAPGSVHAKELVDFWVNHFKAHVIARCGPSVESYCSEDRVPPQKRRRLSITPAKSRSGDIGNKSVMAVGEWHADQDPAVPMDGGAMANFGYDIEANWGGVEYTPNTKYLRSSEEPGQARRASQSPPIFGDNFGVDVPSGTFHSQRSALFPWDMAGGSSSISARAGEVQVFNDDRMSVEQADARLRGSSPSQRGSSLPSLPGNLQAGIGSPAVISRMVQSDDDFVFDVPGDDDIGESRHSESVALEKNSHNFLEYAKMQYRSLPSTIQYLAFDDVVPRATSTARVAAAALYHCLVLATKDLLQVDQEEPYGRIDIRII